MSPVDSLSIIRILTWSQAISHYNKPWYIGKCLAWSNLYSEIDIFKGKAPSIFPSMLPCDRSMLGVASPS